MNARLYIGPDQEPDRYRLLKSIGRGGEATLYLAELELAGATEPVVVKILDSRATLTPADFQRISTKWRDQAELLRFVHRPGVVGVREHFEGPPTHPRGTSQAVSGRALYLVMNHVEGLDLLFRIVGTDRCMFGTENPGTGTYKDPQTGKMLDDLKPEIESISWMTDQDRKNVFEDVARKVFPRFND